ERIRFPVNPETDMYIIANTWGSGRGVNAANYSNVLVELQSQKELGIDVQQIDDGWQKNNAGTQTGGWYPHTDKFPNGFQPVKTAANLLNVKLGLWFASMPVTLKEMKDNFDAGGFSYCKLDFANLNNHANLEKIIEKTRAFELYTQHKSKVNWDVTEVAPRFGYFWAKEYGCVFLENRKTTSPVSVIYTPYLVLRDLWHLSKYCNLNKFQGTVQNIEMVDTQASDAYKHNHPYAAAIPLMSTPLFFQETHFYSQQAKDQIKNVLAAYKNVRNDMYECLVYPIGNEPNNASWSGFQAQHPDKTIGFIHLFREINNTDSTQNIQLRFLKNKKITFTNLLTNECIQVTSDGAGFVKFDIQNPCDFRMYKYEYVDNTVGFVEHKTFELYGYFNQNTLQIIAPESGSFSIFTMNGQNVLNGTFKGASVLPVNLPFGNYLLKMKCKGMNYASNVIIQNT
ncbi:MAG: alpha-galactosidase, partial [Bacteroidia bacterium]|nr:alpha-galactosidase [Bacteroidia bacterium]